MSKIDPTLFSAHAHALEREYHQCPECGAELVVRHGKSGPFLGCSGYPTCQYIRSLSQPSVAIEKVLTGSSCPLVAMSWPLKKAAMVCSSVVPTFRLVYTSSLRMIWLPCLLRCLAHLVGAGTWLAARPVTVNFSTPVMHSLAASMWSMSRLWLGHVRSAAGVSWLRNRLVRGRN